MKDHLLRELSEPKLESDTVEVELLHDPRERVALYSYGSGENRLYTAEPISSEVTLATIFDTLNDRPQPNSEVLGGRGGLLTLSTPRGEEFVMKSYRRGGFLRKVLPATTFIASGESRARLEYRALLSAARVGVEVPEPVGYIVRGDWFRKEWLIMRRLPEHQSLASLGVAVESGESTLLLEPIFLEVVRQIEKLIAAGIFHSDLHPGNVLVLESGEVVLIDFDRAERVTLSPRAFRERYIRRWRRAVIKHGLPEVLSELFCSLLKIGEESWDGEA